jgi:hypothetical protein
MEQLQLVLMTIGGAMIVQSCINFWKRVFGRGETTTSEEAEMETDNPVEPAELDKASVANEGGKDPANTEFPPTIKPKQESAVSVYSPSLQLKPNQSAAHHSTINGSPIVNLPPYRATYKQSLEDSEDRIYTGLLNNRYPLIIVADGASTSIADGSEVSGYGGEAAEQAMQISQERLGKWMTPVRRSRRSKAVTLTGLLAEMHTIYDEVSSAISEKKIRGSTTLLIAMLVAVSGGAYWVYAFLGDGWMALLNPSRQINGWLIPLFPMAPGHGLPGGGTATLPTQSFLPIVGAIAHQPGDVLVVASDGIDAVEKTLFARTRIDLGNTIWRENFARRPGRIPRWWRVPDIEDVTLSDDLSIGLIWTGGSRELNRSVR